MPKSFDSSGRHRFNLRVFGGSSHPELTRQVARKVGVRVGEARLSKFANKETGVELLENVRGQDVYVVQTGGGERPNDSLMELLFLINAFRLASADSITVITPFFPYSKGDQRDGNRVPISSRLVADLVKMAGASHFMMLDPHTPQLEGFFGKPVDSLKVEPFFCEWIKKNISEWQDCIVVSPDEGAVKRAVSVANDLALDFALIHNRSRLNKLYSTVVPHEAMGASTDVGAEGARVDGPGEEGRDDEGIQFADGIAVLPETRSRNASSTYSRSSSTALSGIAGSGPTAGYERLASVSGTVTGRTVIMIDDMIDTGKTLKFALDVLKREGAERVYFLATHGVFSRGSFSTIASAGSPDRADAFLAAIVVTNSIPQDGNKEACDTDFHVMDVSGLIAEYIRRHHYRESIMCLSQFMPRVRGQDRAAGNRPRRLFSALSGLKLTEAPSATDAYENSPAPEDIPVDDTPEGMEGAQRPSAVPRRIGFRMSSICWDYEDEDEDRS